LTALHHSTHDERSMKVEFLGRTCRGWHILPRIYPSIPPVRTRLLVFLWWSWVLIPAKTKE